MASTTLQRDGVLPLGKEAAVLSPGRVDTIAFQHRGGFATLVKTDPAAPGAPSLCYMQPSGVLYKVKTEELSQLSKRETGYSLQPVKVQTYSEKRVRAVAFQSDPSLLLARALPPPRKYLNLLQQGAAEQDLALEYQAWLANVPAASEDEPLGPEYFDTPSQWLALALITAVALLALAFMMYV